MVTQLLACADPCCAAILTDVLTHVFEVRLVVLNILSPGQGSVQDNRFLLLLRRGCAREQEIQKTRSNASDPGQGPDVPHYAKNTFIISFVSNAYPGLISSK